MNFGLGEIVFSPFTVDHINTVLRDNKLIIMFTIIFVVSFCNGAFNFVVSQIFIGAMIFAMCCNVDL